MDGRFGGLGVEVQVEEIISRKGSLLRKVGLVHGVELTGLEFARNVTEDFEFVL